jgi:hypothetical protein
MSGKVKDWIRSRECGIDNCKSTKYYEQDGLRYCFKCGHLQEVYTPKAFDSLHLNTSADRIYRGFKPNRTMRTSAHRAAQLAADEKVKIKYRKSTAATQLPHSISSAISSSFGNNATPLSTP